MPCLMTGVKIFVITGWTWLIVGRLYALGLEAATS